jgi:translation initiation factor 1
MGWKEELERMRGQVPQGEAPAAAPAAVPATAKGPARAVVRYQRKGHGGKEVTVVEKLELPAPELESWLKALKQGLGCGGRVEGEALVLQGDQRERLPSALQARGVRKVTVAG